MSDALYDSEQKTSAADTQSESGENTVCVDANRIYDSCGAKDCLSDMTLIFTDQNQCLINNACSVKICKASVITATVNVEPVAFHCGFYAVDMMFYFDVVLDVYSTMGAIPQPVNGLAMYGKRVVLYGGESKSKIYYSDDPVNCESPQNCCCKHNSDMPRAGVQISDPMALSAKLHDKGKPYPLPCVDIPQCVCDYFDGDFVKSAPKWVTVTIGIFTITQLERNVQMMIPSYDFCVPRKECKAKTDDPCEVFSKIEFPTASFFPPRVGDSGKDCGCSD